MRVSKQGSEDFDELVDVQVTSPFYVEAAGRVGKTGCCHPSHGRNSRTNECDMESLPRQNRPRRSASERYLVTRCHETDLMHLADTTRVSLPSATAPSDTRFPSPLPRGSVSRSALCFSSAAWCGDSLTLLVLLTLEFCGPFLACPVCSGSSHPVLIWRSVPPQPRRHRHGVCQPRRWLDQARATTTVSPSSRC